MIAKWILSGIAIGFKAVVAVIVFCVIVLALLGVLALIGTILEALEDMM